MTLSAAETARRPSKDSIDGHYSNNARGLESTLACKQPSMDSGATAIGSAARAPDGKFQSSFIRFTGGKSKTIGVVLIKLESPTRSSSANYKDLEYAS
jgi:hypothetical protein